MPKLLPIHSSLAADPVLGEIVEMFVDEIPSKIDALRAQAGAGDWDALERTAHQLKGALGSYGFASLTSYAQNLEQSAREHRTKEAILKALDELIAVCNCVQHGTTAY